MLYKKTGQHISKWLLYTVHLLKEHFLFQLKYPFQKSIYVFEKIVTYFAWHHSIPFSPDSCDCSPCSAVSLPLSRQLFICDLSFSQIAFKIHCFLRLVFLSLDTSFCTVCKNSEISRKDLNK